MFPREIFKQIRQIEIRTNRCVTETLAGAMKTKAGVLNREIRQIREKGNKPFAFVLFEYFAWFAVYFRFCNHQTQTYEH